MEDMSNYYVDYLSPPGGRGGDTSIEEDVEAAVDLVFGPGAQSTPAPVSQVTQEAQRRHREYVVGSTTQSKF